PRSALFPYTTLFRSILDAVVQVFPDDFHIEGVAADDARRKLSFYEAARYMRGAIALAPAYDAVLSFNFDDARTPCLVQPASRGGEGALDRCADNVACNFLDGGHQFFFPSEVVNTCAATLLRVFCTSLISLVRSSPTRGLMTTPF